MRLRHIFVILAVLCAACSSSDDSSTTSADSTAEAIDDSDASADVGDAESSDEAESGDEVESDDTTTTTAATTETTEAADDEATAEADDAAEASEAATADAPTGFDVSDLGDGWLEVGHVPGPGEEDCQCSDGSEWNFYVREGASASSQVMVLFEGGGSCWTEVTCNPESGFYKTTVFDGREGYNATVLTGLGGVFDEENAENPLADYTVVFVPYCTGDVHLGNAEVTYGDVTVQHRGAVNARVALDWVVEQYPDVEDLFVTGMSAGAIPAPLYAGVLADELPNARVTSLNDAAGGYPSVPEISAIVEQNGAMQALPEWAEFDGLAAADLGIPSLTWRTGIHNPNITQARFDNAYDNVQILFRQLLQVPADDLLDELVSIDEEIGTNGRDVASWISPGDAHTILMDDRLYTETVDGNSFLAWLTDLVEGRPVDDVICTDCAS